MIWDTGGTDRIVYNGGRDTTIDLRAATLDYEVGGGGFVSAADGVAGGYTIANGVVIENASGDRGADLIIGNSAGNRLTGGNGNDRIKGNSGADGIAGGNGNDRLFGGSGNDRLVGGNGNDRLYGNDGADKLFGNAGSDRFFGGKGVDVMIGGNGRDGFVFTNATDSGVGTSRDQINDFDRRYDIINLRGIDADSTSGGNDAFTFIGGGRFSDTAGEVRITERADGVIVTADIGGDGVGDFQIMVLGVNTLDARDFVL